MEVGVPYSNQTTSRDAAESMVDHVAKQDDRILKAIHEAEAAGRAGMTAEEVSLALGMRINSVTARINGLRFEQRKLDATVWRRKNTSGRWATVYGPATDGGAAPKAKGHGRPSPTVAAERERVLEALREELESRGMDLFRDQLLLGVRHRLAT